MIVKEPRILLVDLHDTLIPLSGVVCRIFADVAGEVCPTADREQLVQYYLDSRGTPLDEKIRTVLLSAGKKRNLEKESRLLAKKLWKRIAQLPVKPFPEIKSDLLELKKNGWRLFVSTDNPLWVARSLVRNAGLEGFFSGVLGKPRLRSHKVPAHVRILAERFGIPKNAWKNHFVFYGDSPGEMRWAKRIGVRAIGRTTSYPVRVMREAGANGIVKGTGRTARGFLKKQLGAGNNALCWMQK